MRWVFIVTAFFVLSFRANAGILPGIGESLHKKPKPFFNFTGYTSFIKGDWATFSGVRGGLNFNNTVKFGLGISHLNSSVVTPIHINENNLSYSTNGSLKFTYAEVSVEYIFYNESPWQFSVPVALGVGNAHYNYISRRNNELTHSSNYPLWILQPEADAQYTVVKWIAVNSSLGYITTLHTPDPYNNGVNSITFSIGFRLFLDEIWKSLSQKD